MSTAAYSSISRQSGLLNEMQVVANNIANSATTGYRSEGLIFSEFVSSDPGQESLSMARGNIRNTSLEQGNLNQTNGPLDIALEGDGFFMVETPDGNRLTRSGHFTTNSAGDLVTSDGYRVLDAGEAPVFIPGDASSISIGSDGTYGADGQQLGQIGVFKPTEGSTIIRQDGVMFRVDGEVEPTETAKVLQGFLEGSNVNAVHQLSRMIEIQRAYEMGQSFLTSEDERVRGAIESLTK